MKSKIHIGSLIERKVKERGIKIADFAKAINCSRPNVNSIFLRKSIDAEQLQLISEVLNYDFLELYLSKENKSNQKYISIIEHDGLKLNELYLDKSIIMIQTWRTSK